MKLVFDLDGTIANISHRQSILRKSGKKDWDTFFELCTLDKPNEPIVKLLKALLKDCNIDKHIIYVWTARPEKYRTQTIDWLVKHIFKDLYIEQYGLTNYDSVDNETIFNTLVDELRMRPDGCRIDDDVLKMQWLYEDAFDTGSYPDIIFEDRNRIVDMYRQAGVTCFQVAPGDF